MKLFALAQTQKRKAIAKRVALDADAIKQPFRKGVNLNIFLKKKKCLCYDILIIFVNKL